MVKGLPVHRIDACLAVTSCSFFSSRACGLQWPIPCIRAATVSFFFCRASRSLSQSLREREREREVVQSSFSELETLGCDWREGHDADTSGDWCKSWFKDWRTCGSFFKISVSVSSGDGSRSCLACLFKWIGLDCIRG